MYEYYFTFQSISAAQDACNLLLQNNIPAILAKAPRTVVSKGCAHAIRISQAFYYPVLQLIALYQVRYLKVLRLTHSGSVEEVLP